MSTLNLVTGLGREINCQAVIPLDQTLRERDKPSRSSKNMEKTVEMLRISLITSEDLPSY